MTTNFSLTPKEHQLLATVFEFANLPSIDSVGQIHELFGEFITQGLKPGEEQAFRDDQKRLRGWLDRLLVKDGRTDHALNKAVQATLGRTATAQVGLIKGRIGVLEFKTPGVEACFAFAVALLIDSGRGLTPFLRRCAAPNCGRYFLAPKSRGRSGSWCMKAHQKAAQAALNLQRVRRWLNK